MSKQQATHLFIKYQSLHQIYKERAEAYRRSVGRKVRVYSDDLARLALSKANYYQELLQEI